jgi:hypothetical protein
VAVSAQDSTWSLCFSLTWQKNKAVAAAEHIPLLRRKENFVHDYIRLSAQAKEFF